MSFGLYAMHGQPKVAEQIKVEGGGGEGFVSLCERDIAYVAWTPRLQGYLCPVAHDSLVGHSRQQRRLQKSPIETPRHIFQIRSPSPSTLKRTTQALALPA